MVVEPAPFVVAGATGHVGSVVAARLLGHRKRIRVIVRDATKGARWADRGAEVAVGNVGDANFVREALGGAAGFFTLIPPDYAAAEVFAAQRRYADAISSGVAASAVPHVVLLSSLGAELASGTGPIKGLHYFENRLRETGTTLTAIRAAYFQENAAMALEPARTMGIFAAFGDRDDLPMPMIATRDVGELAAQALLEPPAASQVVDIVGPEYSPRDVALALGKALGKELRIVKIPQPQWAATLRQAGIPPSASEAMAEMFGALAGGIVRPKGDRLVHGTTTLADTVRNLV
jgi:uncharacterized protein YbjT (DUF2867 family)